VYYLEEVFIDGDSVGFGHQHFMAVPGTSEMENHAVKKDKYIKKFTLHFTPLSVPLLCSASDIEATQRCDEE
jgi:hypothetical protein